MPRLLKDGSSTKVMVREAASGIFISFHWKSLAKGTLWAVILSVHGDCYSGLPLKEF